MKQAIFANPQFFYLLILVPVIVFLYWHFYKKNTPYLKLSTLKSLDKKPQSWRARLVHVPAIFYICSLILIIVAMARPQSISVLEKVKTEGIDIVISMDISQSMYAPDLEPSRLEAAKKTAIEFVRERPNDRIGVVLFAAESFTAIPLTADKRALEQTISQINNNGVLDQGTAIGMGLANALARLEESKAKSKIVILMTDGVNNAGSVDPTTALEIAKTMGIKVYTIGVGTYGEVRMPVQTPFGIQYMNQKVEIDEELLKNIAKETGGQYFRATDNAKFAEIYRDINKLEKTQLEINSSKKYNDMYYVFLLVGLVLVILAALLKSFWLRSIN